MFPSVRRRKFDSDSPRSAIQTELDTTTLTVETGDAINSTALQITWAVSPSLASIEGYVINLTHVPHDMGVTGVTTSVRVLDPFLSHTVLTRLRPHAMYDVCVSAYIRDVIGECSLPIRVRTWEAGRSGQGKGYWVQGHSGQGNVIGVKVCGVRARLLGSRSVGQGKVILVKVNGVRERLFGLRFVGSGQGYWGQCECGQGKGYWCQGQCVQGKGYWGEGQ